MQADDSSGSARNNDMSDVNEQALEYVRDICQVTRERGAQELLEAATVVGRSNVLSTDIHVNVNVSSATTVTAVSTAVDVAVDLSASEASVNVNAASHFTAANNDIGEPITNPSSPPNERKRQTTTTTIGTVTTSGTPCPSTKATMPSKQRKLDSFLGSVKSQQKKETPSKQESKPPSPSPRNNPRNMSVLPLQREPQDVDDSSSVKEVLVAKHVAEPEPEPEPELAQSKDPREDEQRQEGRPSIRCPNRDETLPLMPTTKSESDPRLAYVALARSFAEMCATIGGVDNF
jgi:hypothetical protein